MQDFQVYVINLESRKDRRAEMVRQLTKVGWSADFFPAVRPRDAGGFQTIGTHGCFLSHLGVFKKASEQDRHLILLEDDLNFAPRFGDLWASALQAISTVDWSIFYPGHLLRNVPPGLHRVGASKGLWCAHFMVVNKNKIQTMAAALETILSRPPGDPMGGPMHVDSAYSLIREQNPELETYIYSPVLGYQRASRSDISAPRWYDRIKVLRPALDLMRKFKKVGSHSQVDDTL